MLPPNLLSLARLPLAVLFPLVAQRPSAALGVLLAAGLTDVLDGWLARRTGRVTATGAIVDPIADKTFAFAVGATLVAQGRLPLWGIVALLARELLELPLLLWIAFGARFRGERLASVRSNVPGKLATVLQFVVVLSALLLPAALSALLVLAAAAGAIAGASYWLRQLRRGRPQSLVSKS